MKKKSIESRLMSQKMMTKFIEEYKKHSSLWDPNNTKYYNKTGRWEAYRKLVDIVKPYYNNADVNFVRKKINTLHGIIRKEHNKYMQSLKSGNNVYKPKLWYYSLMDFIINNDRRFNRAYQKNEVYADSIDCSIAEIPQSEVTGNSKAGKKNRQLSKKLLTAFIKKYEENPCLWKIGDPSYNSKKIKDRALDDLVELVKEECPEANRNFVKKKLNTLRGSARMEHKKYLSFRGSKKDYKPSLWYYNLIKFVFTHRVNKNVVEDFQNTAEIIPSFKDHPNNQCVENDEFPHLAVSEEYIYSTEDQSDKTESNLNNVFYVGNRKHYEFHCFAKAVAAKLRKIHTKDETQRYICEKLINDILLKGFQNKLTDKTVLTEPRQIQFYYSHIGQETIEIPGSSKVLNNCDQQFLPIS